MKLLILILNKVEKLKEVLEGFIEVGISGATIIDSVGMGHIISEEVPIFAGLCFMFSGVDSSGLRFWNLTPKVPHNLAIFTISFAVSTEPLWLHPTSAITRHFCIFNTFCIR